MNNPESAHKRCPHCNAPIITGDGFCSRCGSSVQSSPHNNRTKKTNKLKKILTNDFVGFLIIYFEFDLIIGGIAYSQGESITAILKVTLLSMLAAPFIALWLAQLGPIGALLCLF